MPATIVPSRRFRTWHGAIGTALILLVIWAQSIVPLAALRMAAEAAPAGTTGSIYDGAPRNVVAGMKLAF